MRTKTLPALLLSLTFLVTGQAVAQRSVKEYPSRLKTSQSYSYYRYRRWRVVNRPAQSNPLNRRVSRSRINSMYGPLRRNIRPSNRYYSRFVQQVFEEEIIEEFRTWPEQAEDHTKAVGSRLDAMEREISDVKIMLARLSEEIASFQGKASSLNEKEGPNSEELEKIVKLKKELVELRALLEEFRKK